MDLPITWLESIMVEEQLNVPAMSQTVDHIRFVSKDG